MKARRVRRPLVLGLVAIACACGSYGTGDAVSVPDRDGGPADAEGDTTSDGGLPGDADAEATVARSCPPIGSQPPSDGGTARSTVAIRSMSAKTIDGQLADFVACPALAFDATSAAFTYGTTPEGKATVFVEWDSTALYVGIDVFGKKTTVDASDPYKNPSVEIFVSGLGTAKTGDYGPRDHHYVIDASGFAREYAGGNPGTDPSPGLTWSVLPAGVNYHVEARIDAAVLGGPLVAGSTLAFDVQLNPAFDESVYWIWALEPHGACTCTTCTCNAGIGAGDGAVDTPAFDTLLFAPLTLE